MTEKEDYTKDVGPAGPQGDKGDKGDKGDTGDTGPPGTTTWAGITDKPSTFTPLDHTHQSAGGQGAKIDHGLALDGLADDDHTQYIKHALATAINDFLVASGTGTFVKKTLAETKALIEAWPVGSVFLSIVNTNPNTLLGYGTWSQISQGRMLIGQDGTDADFDTAEETGGSKVKTIQIGNLPSHNHPIKVGWSGSGGTSQATWSGYDAQGTAHTDPVGSNVPLGIMNPYFVVYIWKRTA